MPHACYMYCGHAVRTALAIGIAREPLSRSIEDRKAARRTWWCIYSHEMDMSCSAGRRDSLGKPRNYEINLPDIAPPVSNTAGGTELESCKVAMINEMVHLAGILRQISKELYYDSKSLTLLQKSTVAKHLDARLDSWRAQLPDCLSFDRTSLRDEEWSAKQKLVLHLRYLNAKLVLHRPFLQLSMSRTSTAMSCHVDSCLDAARDTVRVMYDAYTSRHYFRTWWYNSTYTLYAGMIILYIVMLDYAAVSSNALVEDVTKALDILQSMEESIIARRSANLIREGLEVAQAFTKDREMRLSQLEETEPEREGDKSESQPELDSVTEYDGSDFSNTVNSHDVTGQDPALLAYIIDPSLLHDFTAAEKNIADSGLSAFSFDSASGNGLDVDLASILGWIE